MVSKHAIVTEDDISHCFAGHGSSHGIMHVLFTEKGLKRINAAISKMNRDTDRLAVLINGKATFVGDIKQDFSPMIRITGLQSLEITEISQIALSINKE